MMMKILVGLRSRHHNSRKLLSRHNYWSQGCPGQGKGHKVNGTQTVRLIQSVFLAGICLTGCDRDNVGATHNSFNRQELDINNFVSHQITRRRNYKKYLGSKTAPTFSLTGAACRLSERQSVTIKFKLNHCLMTFVTS